MGIQCKHDGFFLGKFPILSPPIPTTVASLNSCFLARGEVPLVQLGRSTPKTPPQVVKGPCPSPSFKLYQVSQPCACLLGSHDPRAWSNKGAILGSLPPPPIYLYMVSFINITLLISDIHPIKYHPFILTMDC